MLSRRAALIASIVLGLASLGQALAADLVLEVLPLRYRTLEQVLPVLLPLVPPPGTISGMQNRLVVRTTPANLSEIRRVLDAIDRQPRKLLITVRQDADVQRGTGGVVLGGAVTRGTSARTGTTGATEARVYSTQSLENDRTAQQVQVLEGSDAFIRVGQSVPVSDRRVLRDGVGGGVVDRTIDYRDILTGFHVRPRVSGDIVTVDVSPQRDTPGQLGRGSVNVQQMSTTVSGRLGEWLEIGGVVSGRSIEAAGTTYRTDAARTDDRRILLKVDEIP